MPSDTIFISSDHPSFPAVEGVRMIVVRVGVKGYFPIHTQLSMRELNDYYDIPEAVVESAVAGSMFGWDVPAARPALDYARLSGEELKKVLRARGYVLEELDQDNPYTQWMNSGSEP